MSPRRLHGAAANPQPVRRGAGATADTSILRAVYNGGPVISCPMIHAGFWGNHYSGVSGTQNVYYSTLQPQLAQFLTDLPRSEFMNVLSQYGIGAGYPNAGVFMGAHKYAVTGTFTDVTIQQHLQYLIDTGVLPEPVPIATADGTATAVAVIFLDDTVTVDDPNFAIQPIVMCEPQGDNAFGYHRFFTTNAGNPMYYAVVPALDDSCVSESCAGIEEQCALNLSQTQLQRLTEEMSHEIAEMLTDPQPFTGRLSPLFGEIGDICAGPPQTSTDTITVGSNTWTVQKIYSLDTDNSTNGQTTCIASTPSPLPRAPGAPGAPIRQGGAHFRPGHLDRLLPLPTIQEHGENKSLAASESSFAIAEHDLAEYLSRVTLPLRGRDLPGHLPQLLRQAADYVERDLATRTEKSPSGVRDVDEDEPLTSNPRAARVRGQRPQTVND